MVKSPAANMKVLIIASLCAAAFNLVQTLPETMMQDIQDCKNETHVPESDMELFMDKKMPETKEGKCMMACIMKKTDCMLEDGKMNVPGMKAMIAEAPGIDKGDIPKLQQITDLCNGEVPYTEDHCENAILITQCTVKKAEEMGVKQPEGM